MTRPISTAQYFPWDGGALFIGTAGALPAHSHQAIQICFLFDGRIRLRTNNVEPWLDYDLAIVRSRQSHAMDGSSVYYGATLFIEPETREGRILAERCAQDGITELDWKPVATVLPELLAAFLEQRGRSAIVELARRVVQSLTQDTAPSTSSDPRILRAVNYINQHLSESITLKQVAAEACLSPSRFRHLFVAQTGMGLRQYVLWRRFISVWEHRMNGASLSSAAHAAGFADSAHLTRTSRRMIGIPPSLFDISGRAPGKESAG